MNSINTGPKDIRNLLKYRVEQATGVELDTGQQIEVIGAAKRIDDLMDILMDIIHEMEESGLDSDIEMPLVRELISKYSRTIEDRIVQNKENKFSGGENMLIWKIIQRLLHKKDISKIEEFRMLMKRDNISDTIKKEIINILARY